MGTMFSSLFGNKEVTVFMLGRGNAGKTAILNRLQGRETLADIATIGFNLKTVQHDNIKFHLWEVGGQTKIRYAIFPNAQAIIYVVDSRDTDMLVIAKDELQAILEKEELKGVAVLIFANKQDLPGALDDDAITEALELRKIKFHLWAIFKTSATKGEGLCEGLDWLSDILKDG